MAVERQITNRPAQEQPIPRNQTVNGTADGYELAWTTVPVGQRTTEKVQPGGQPPQRP